MITPRQAIAPGLARARAMRAEHRRILMSCGRCQKRGAVIGNALKSVRQGNVGQAARRIGVVAASMSDDARRLAAQNLNRARAIARLNSGRR